jgi:protein-tyrosine phosphatase
MSVCEILPGLWLGNINSAKSNDFFQIYNISIVINCSKDIPFFSNFTKNIRISVNDNLQRHEIDRMFDYLDKACDLIHNSLLNSESILVHCFAGKQRSATLICAYLMKYGNMSLEVAIQSIKSKRDIIFTPIINFKNTLLKYQQYLKSK